METETILILLFVVATAVANAVQRLAVPYTVALVFTGLVLGLLHAFEAPHLTKALLFNVFLPGLLFEAAFHIEFKRFWRNRLTINSPALPGVVAAIALTATILTPVANGLHFVQNFTWKHALVFGATICFAETMVPVSVCRHRPGSPWRRFWEYVAFALNSIVFLLIGLEVHFQALLASWQAILVAYLVVTGGRALIIFGVSSLLRGTRERIPWAWSVILTWGGLRGGLPMVLVLSLPKDFAHRELLVSMTFGIVILSILVHGLAMSHLLRWLGIVRGHQERAVYELTRGKLSYGLVRFMVGMAGYAPGKQSG